MFSDRGRVCADAHYATRPPRSAGQALSSAGGSAGTHAAAEHLVSRRPRIPRPARQLGVDTAKVRLWMERGHLESFRIAGRHRYFVDQLEVLALKVISEEQR